MVCRVRTNRLSYESTNKTRLNLSSWRFYNEKFKRNLQKIWHLPRRLPNEKFKRNLQKIWHLPKKLPQAKTYFSEPASWCFYLLWKLMILKIIDCLRNCFSSEANEYWIIEMFLTRGQQGELTPSFPAFLLLKQNISLFPGYFKFFR